MREFYQPDRRVDTNALDRFLTQEAEELCGVLRSVMNDAFYGVPNPTLAKIPDGYYESLLFSDINRPSAVGEDVAEPLVVSLIHRGLRVEQAELPYNHLGAYSGGSITYRRELTGILRASVIAHESGHHFAEHTPHEEPDPGQEAIAESAALLALRALDIDTGRVSIPDIERYIARTSEINGFTLWTPHQEGIPPGMRQAQAAAKQIVLAVEAGRMPRGFL